MEDLLCPSSPCKKGALLLGVIESNGKVALINTPLKVDRSFILKVAGTGHPEKRFRFANKCITSGCEQWTDGGCKIIATLNKLNSTMNEAMLKPCFIRSRCRWFTQEGSKACTICPYVITDTRR